MPHSSYEDFENGVGVTINNHREFLVSIVVFACPERAPVVNEWEKWR
jgi:hypothetical protein